MKLVNNTAVDPNGKLSSASWQFLLYNDENITYKGSDWVQEPDDTFPAGRAFAYSNESSATLRFTGSEVPPLCTAFTKQFIWHAPYCP